MSVITVGKRDFLLHTSKYIKMAELNDHEIIIAHHKKPMLHLSVIKQKNIRDLKGIIKKIETKDDINAPILPSYDQW